MRERSLSRIPFDPREEKTISSLARWMGLLGRAQIVAGAFVLVTATEFSAGSEVEEPPLVSVGEVSRETVAGIVAGVLLYSWLIFRGGMLLIGAAEGFEKVVATDDLDQQHLEEALRKLRQYFIIECILVLGVIFVVLGLHKLAA
jgi:hypothetical protein